MQSKQIKEFSDDVLQFLLNNLKVNPVTTSVVLSYFQNKLKDEKSHLKKIHDLYINTLNNEITNDDSVDRLTSLLSILQFDEDFLDDFVNKILKNIPKVNFKQYKKQIFIGVIAQKRPQLLTTCSSLLKQYEQSQGFQLTSESMLEMCYQEKVHWLSKAIQVYKHQINDMKHVTFKINNFTMQVLVMVLIDIINIQENYHLSSLVQQLNNIFSILNSYEPIDRDLQLYMTEVKRELTITKFCLENNCKLSSTSIFNQILSQSALAVIAQVCQLSKVDRYKVSRLLSTNNDIVNELLPINAAAERNEKTNVNWDIVTYNSYCAITSIIDIILSTSKDNNAPGNMTMLLEEVKRLLISLQPIEYCIEIIENIFTCLFLRYEQFSCDDDLQDSLCGHHSDCSYFFSKKQTKGVKEFKNSNSGFICNASTTESILNTLKYSLETLGDKIKNEDISSSLMERFKNIVQFVNHSLWKMQLVSTLSPDTTQSPLKLCLDYVEVAESSEDDEGHIDITRRRSRVRRRHTNPKSDGDIMITSTISAKVQGNVIFRLF